MVWKEKQAKSWKHSTLGDINYSNLRLKGLHVTCYFVLTSLCSGWLLLYSRRKDTLKEKLWKKVSQILTSCFLSLHIKQPVVFLFTALSRLKVNVVFCVSEKVWMPFVVFFISMDFLFFIDYLIIIWNDDDDDTTSSLWRLLIVKQLLKMTWTDLKKCRKSNQFRKKNSDWQKFSTSLQTWLT